MKTTVWKTILAVAALGFMCSSAEAMVQYTFTDLGPGLAYSINNNGQIVGSSYNDVGKLRATLFDASGVGNNRNLSPCLTGGEYSQALSINDSGLIVGYANVFSPEDCTIMFRAFLFDSTGDGNNIQLGGNRTLAECINNNNVIGGYAVYAAQNGATLFDISGNGANTDLGTLEGFMDGTIFSMNDNDVAVGYASASSGHTKAALFDTTGNGNHKCLGTLGGEDSGARFINDHNQIVGWAYDTMGQQKATLFDSSGMGCNVNLAPANDDASTAWCTNNASQIVGWTDDSTGKRYATLFDATGGGNNIDLNDAIDPSLGWSLQIAYSINDSGWIVGYGINPEGQQHAFLLQPVPEPATLCLFAFGAVALWRRRQA